MKKLFKNLTVLLILISFFAIGGCKKKDGPLTTPPAINGKVKTSTNSDGSGTPSTTTYTYDSGGKLTMMQQNDQKITIVWTSSKVVMNFYDSTGTIIVEKDSAVLNAQGYISSNNGITFTYDSEGHRTGATSTNETDVYTWSGGNCTSIVYTSASNPVETNSFNYLTDKTDYRSFGMEYIEGKGNKNLIGSDTDNKSGSPVTTTYTYEYDSKGRVSKETKVSTGSTQINSYTYFD